MFKFLQADSKTTKADVIMALAAALVGVYKAFDTIKDYKSDNEESE